MDEERLLRNGREAALQHFRWIDGDADTWSMLRDAGSLSAIVRSLSVLAARDSPDVIVGIEARGFALAPAVAVALGIGFSPLRRGTALFPGETVRGETNTDYRGRRHQMAARRDHFVAGQRAVLVDDWIETGSQAVTAAELVASCGAVLVSIAVIIDETSNEARSRLPTVRSLLLGADLP